MYYFLLIKSEFYCIAELCEALQPLYVKIELAMGSVETLEMLRDQVLISLSTMVYVFRSSNRNLTDLDLAKLLIQGDQIDIRRKPVNEVSL